MNFCPRRLTPQVLVSFSQIFIHHCTFPTDTWRNDNVFITSKQRRRRRLDVMKTLLLRRVPTGFRWPTESSHMFSPTFIWLRKLPYCGQDDVIQNGRRDRVTSRHKMAEEIPERLDTLPVKNTLHRDIAFKHQDLLLPKIVSLAFRPRHSHFKDSIWWKHLNHLKTKCH